MPTLFRLFPILLISSLLRLGFLIYGLLQDAYSPVKYTDIDYLVFTDAVRFVSQGRSPYLRETYRYTPLLAWLLFPTAWPGLGGAWFSFGKVVFAAADIVAGWLLYLILRSEGRRKGQHDSKGMDEARALKFASVWLLNPMVITISTRGSSEGLLGAMVMAMLWATLNQRPGLAGFFLGLGVHFKIYPFIYAPSLLLYFTSPGRPSPTSSLTDKLRHFCNPSRISLTLAAATTFLILNIAMYTLYGFPFLQHTFLHHLTRIDHRHNFSPYNTLLYASSASASTSHSTPPSSFPPLESLAFLPQLSLSLLLPIFLVRHHLPSTLLAQTHTFVTLNKVCTSQYFLWFLIFLPLYLPYSRFLKRPGLGVVVLAVWVGMQAWWLMEAYLLEFEGESRFLPGLWGSGLGFCTVNLAVLGVVVGDVGGIEGGRGGEEVVEVVERESEWRLSGKEGVDVGRGRVRFKR